MRKFSGRRTFWPPFAALCCSAVLAISLETFGLTGSLQASERRTAIVQAVEGARDCVVNIHGQKTLTAADDPAIRFEGPRRVNGMGTGVIIDPRGYIITNFHVVDGVKKIEVTMSTGETHIAELVSTEPSQDLAVIKINVPKPLKVIKIGTSSDLMIGETVIALGNAYGYQHTATRGIISALHRSVQVSDTQSYEELIQTDASINPGNSGGPLLNIDGEMIGVNVAVRAGAQGIGFAIPVDRAMATVGKLISVERVEHKWHGIKSSDSPGRPNGAVVMEIEASSPAAKSGLKAGDVIIGVEENEVARVADFERALLGHRTGEEIKVIVRRNQEPVTINLALAEQPQKAPVHPDEIWDLLGLKLQPIAQQQFRQYQSGYRGGLSVVSVRADSPAAKQGIRRGDVLVGMHIWETISIENVQYVLNRPDFVDLEPLKFYILRGNKTFSGHLPVSLDRRITSVRATTTQ